MKKQRDNWPFWVQFGLWGIRSRTVAWIFFWVAVAIGFSLVIYAFFDPRYLIGGVMFLAALWYFLAIDWVDNYGQW